MKNEKKRPPPRPGTAAAATAFPDLYGGTNWGHATLARNPDITPAIIANRNGFARDWKLRRRCRAMIPRPTVTGRADYDHPELYRYADGWLVLVVSHYGTTPPPPVLGLRKIPPMYREDATSYAGRFATLRELRARLDAAEGGGPKFGAVANLFREPPTPRRKRFQGRGKVTA